MTEPNTKLSTSQSTGSSPPLTQSSTSDSIVSTAAIQNSLTSILSASWSVVMPQISASIRQQVSEALQTAGINQGQLSEGVSERVVGKIWRNEFVELHELLPARLGIPQLTLMDVLASSSTQKAPPKQISTIKEWVMCFNTYTALTTVKQPERMKDLLAYSSTIVNASKQFEGTPWLEYDTRFRKEAVVQPGKQWASIDASTWTICFTSAKPKQEPTRKGQDKRFHPYRPTDNICCNFNNNRCFWKDYRYHHVCSHCEKPNHMDDQCPERKQAKGGLFHPQQKTF